MFHGEQITSPAVRESSHCLDDGQFLPAVRCGHLGANMEAVLVPGAVIDELPDILLTHYSGE